MKTSLTSIYTLVYVVAMTFLLSYLIKTTEYCRNLYWQMNNGDSVSALKYFLLMIASEVMPVIIFYIPILMRKSNKDKKSYRAAISKTNINLLIRSLINKMVCFALCAAVPMLFEFLFEITLLGPSRPIFHRVHEQTAYFYSWNILFVLVAAVCEELICRQIILKYIAKRVATPTAIIISCLGFGLIHWIMVPGVCLPFVLSENLIFCLLYVYRKNGVWCSSGAHFGMNLAGFFVWGSDLILVPPSTFMLNFNSDAAYNDFFIYRSIVICVLSAVLYLFLISKKQR